MGNQVSLTTVKDYTYNRESSNNTIRKTDTICFSLAKEDKGYFD